MARSNSLSKLLHSRSEKTEPHYVMRFYDPNSTLTHKRLDIPGSRLQELKNQPMSNFFDADLCEKYLSGTKNLQIRSLNLDMSEAPDIAKAVKLWGRNISHMPERVLLPLLLGSPAHTPDMKRSMELLEKGEPEVVDAWKKLALTLPPTSRAELLLSQDVHGNTLLKNSFSKGGTAFVKAVQELLVGLTPETIEKILLAKGAHGVSKLDAGNALEHGRAETFAAWAEMVDKLPPKLQLDIITQTRGGYGRTGIERAMHDEDLASISAWKALTKKLPPAPITDLLLDHHSIDRGIYAWNSDIPVTEKTMSVWTALMDGLPQAQRLQLLADFPATPALLNKREDEIRLWGQLLQKFASPLDALELTNRLKERANVDSSDRELPPSVAWTEMMASLHEAARLSERH